MTVELRALARSTLQVCSLLGQTLGSLAAMMVEARAMCLPALATDPAFRLAGSRTCIVAGTGPSLQQDVCGRLDALRETTLFAVNGFALSDLFGQMRPAVYLLLDPDYWREDSQPDAIAHRRALFSALEAKTRWPLLLLAPRACRASSFWSERGGMVHPYIRTCWINRNPVEGFACFRHLAYRLNLGIPWSQNVLVAATFFAVQLGFRHICLLGADHSWHEELEVGQDNLLYIRQKHCYDEPSASRVPFYKCGGQGVFKMHEIYTAWARAFRGYFVVREYAESVGATILNAGSKSYIDAFERVQLDDLLGPAAIPAPIPTPIPTPETRALGSAEPVWRA